ncbi:Rv2993c-like domain-containing protein [Streptomyces sp. NPDC002680]|uniref:Rv2993c-like domain-containing protein n=1 Tax=Streptomyces sp. NPDC002680 TaxID=3364659 RepID=UPI0036B6F59C
MADFVQCTSDIRIPYSMNREWEDMATTVVRYATDSPACWGVLRDDRITPFPGGFGTMGELVELTTTAELAALDGEMVDVNEVQLLSPVTRHRRFVCLGAQYRQQVVESGITSRDGRIGFGVQRNHRLVEGGRS